MAIKSTTLNTDYLVNNTNQKVTLEVIVGAPGQTASSTIEITTPSGNKLKGDLPEKFDGGLSETLIEVNKKLDDTEMIISTIITDRSTETNATELIVRIRGGKFGFKEYPLALMVDNQGESAIYKVSINFIKI